MSGRDDKREKEPEVSPPPIDAKDTMWRIRAEETREEKGGLLASLLGKKKEKPKQESYTQADFKKAIEKGDMQEATHAAEFLIDSARKAGEWWLVEDIYNSLIKRFPEALPNEDICATMFAYGISRSKLKVAETALRQLLRRNPKHELIVKRLPAFIALCIEEKEVRKAAYWLDRYRQSGGDYKTMVALNNKIRELDPSQAFADEWLKGRDVARKEVKEKHQKTRERAETPVLQPQQKPKAPPGVRTYSTLIQDGRLDDALNVLLRCKERPPEDSHPVDHIRLAEGLVRSRRYTDALQVLARVPLWHPDQPEAPQAYYIAAWLMNEVFHAPEKALEALDRIIKFYPGSVFAVKAKNYKEKILSKQQG